MIEAVKDQPPATTPPWGDDDPRDWPEVRRDAWEERAAIMEYDGGLPREEAEAEAWRLLRTPSA